MPNLVFYSTSALERGLDGGEDRFAAYYFAIYHCAPTEDGGINDLRKKLRREFPDKAVPVGRHFVLFGHPAFVALTAYYHALAQLETFGDDFRAYAAERVQAITDAHKNSQSLPVPVDLGEGQLNHDPRLELLTCIALRNGQVVLGDASL
jgi:hypothetical protein